MHYAMIRFKIALPVTAIAVAGVLLVGIIIVELFSMTFVELSSGNEIKIQLNTGVAGLCAVVILACCGLTYYVLRRK